MMKLLKIPLVMLITVLLLHSISFDCQAQSATVAEIESKLTYVQDATVRLEVAQYFAPLNVQASHFELGTDNYQALVDAVDTNGTVTDQATKNNLRIFFTAMKGETLNLSKQIKNH